MTITAVVVADDRVGLDPLTPVGGVPMVVHAVRTLLDTGRVRRIAVLALPDRFDAIAEACRGLPVTVRAGPAPGREGLFGDQRADTRTGDGLVENGTPGLLLLHDSNRPLAPPELAVAVLDAALRGHLAAVPVLTVAETVKQVDPAGMVCGSPDRATLREVQTPQVIRCDLLDRGGPPGADRSGWGDRMGLSPLRAAVRLAGTRPADVHLVPGHPLAFAVRDAGDLERAGLLVRKGVPGAGGRRH